MIDLKITEISPGISGGELTADWIEITNNGTTAWVSGIDPDLFYDDDSRDPAVADLITGISSIEPGESVVVVLGNETDRLRFIDVWDDVLDLSDAKIGVADGAGLGGGGDAATLFLGGPSAGTVVDFQAYPNATATGGATYDVTLGAFSTVGTNGAVATVQLGGPGATQPAIGSPADAPAAAQTYDLKITEIWSGQDGADLTGDWFEIANDGVVAWTAANDPALYYDDVNPNPASASRIFGIDAIPSGGKAIVVIGNEAAAAAFRAVWDDVYDLSDTAVGWTDGAGLGAEGDQVNLFVGGPTLATIVDSQSYPNTAGFSGRSWSVEAQAFSAVGDGTGALATTQTAGTGGAEPAIASPGDAEVALGDFDLQITEIYSGQTGTEVTVDWFEITNKGTTDWVAGVDRPLAYDDDSRDAGVADAIAGLTRIEAGKSVVVVIGDAADAAAFRAVWDDVYDLSDVEIGYTDGAGLGAGGDAVTLFLGTPPVLSESDFETYPNTAANDGKSYDVDLGVFSSVGNANGALATVVLGGTGATPSIASPGNAAPAAPALNLQVTEIWSGQDGADLTADWFEIENVGNVAWTSDAFGNLFYDDAGTGTAGADLISGIDSIAAGRRAIVVVGGEADAAAFRAVWDDVYDLSEIAIGWTNGDGLGTGGDAVRLFSGDTAATTLLDSEAYPDTAGRSGLSYDVELAAFSAVGNASNATETRQTAGVDGTEPAIASPGNLAPRILGPDNAPEPAGVLETAVLGRIAGLPGAEIVAFDAPSQRGFLTSSSGIQVIDLSDPSAPVAGAVFDPALFGSDASLVTSVAVKNGILAAAAPGADQTQPGKVLFFEAATMTFLGEVTVGALPDMLTFTPDGTKVLVANEASPVGSADPKSSVSIIDISGGFGALDVTTADFTSFDAVQADLVAAGLRLFPGKTLSDDVEPEYIAVAADGLTAYVTLQEANAIAVLDIASGSFTEIRPLPAKDHSVDGNGLDYDDQDGAIDIATGPLRGLLMPDGAATFTVGGQTYYITANEGDDRGENVRLSTVTLDPTAFPNAAEIQAEYGRIAISSIDGDTDGDGDFDEIYVYGGRSFSIFDSAGNFVSDSGDEFELIIGSQTPELFNADESVAADFDSRSDAKGPEPESVTTGVIDGRTYAFIAIERAGGGVMVYDVTDPAAPVFDQYLRVANDAAPEGLRFVSAAESPTGAPLLLVSNEVSNSLTIYRLGDAPPIVPISGTPGNDSLFTGTGNDTVYAGLGDDVVGSGAGNDTVFGGAGADKLFGGSGNDRLEGQDGDDILRGEDGDDRLLGGAGKDNLDGGAGADNLSGDDGDDTLNGGAGDDTMSGGDGLDYLFGGTGNDFLSGGEGDDTLDGADGDDNVHGGNGNDKLQGKAGNDFLSGGAGDDTLQGGAGNDQLVGGTGRNTLYGDAGDDILVGGSGVDTLQGGDGADTLFGNTGRDFLYGGAGSDVFEFRSAADTGIGASVRDRIFDWASGDRIDLSAIDADATGGTANDAFAFVGGAAFSAAGQVRFFADAGGNTIVQANLDDNFATAEFEIELNRTVVSLSEADFAL